MKHLLLFCLLNFGVLSLCQAQESRAPFRLELSSNSILTQYDQLRTFRSYTGYSRTKRAYNYSVQLSAFRRLGQRFDLGIGIGVTNLDAYTSDGCLNCDRPFLGDVRSKFRAFELPIELRMDWFKGERKIEPYYSIGIKPRFLLTEWPIPGGTARGFDRFLGLNGGLGTRINWNEKWSMNVGAHFEKWRYQQPQNTGIAPSTAKGIWLNEWSLKVGFSRTF